VVFIYPGGDRILPWAKPKGSRTLSRAVQSARRGLTWGV